jgi:hypothetical protein
MDDLDRLLRDQLVDTAEACNAIEDIEQRVRGQLLASLFMLNQAADLLGDDVALSKLLEAFRGRKGFAETGRIDPRAGLN